jgi:hypothetical protein
MIALYVDDIPAACNDTSWMVLFKTKLCARFKDLGGLSQLDSYMAYTLLATSPLVLTRQTNRSARGVSVAIGNG